MAARSRPALPTPTAISCPFLTPMALIRPSIFPSLCKEILSGAEVVVGSRMAGAKSEMPKTRRLGNLIFARLVSIIGNQKVTDSASGMRVFRREALERMYPLPDGLNFTPVMSTRAIHEGIKMVEVPIPYSERVGRSKLSVVNDGLRFFNSIVLTALSYNPVRILGLIGLAGVGFAAIVASVLFVLRLSGVTQLGSLGIFAVFGALVLGVTGVSLFSPGRDVQLSCVAVPETHRASADCLASPFSIRRSRHTLAGSARLQSRPG